MTAGLGGHAQWAMPEAPGLTSNAASEFRLLARSRCRHWQASLRRRPCQWCRPARARARGPPERALPRLRCPAKLAALLAQPSEGT